MLAGEDILSSTLGPAPTLVWAQLCQAQPGYPRGPKRSVALGYTPSHYGDPEIFVAQAIKRAWEATGMVSVTLNEKEWADYKVAWRAGQFDVFLLGWFPDYFDSDDYVFPFLHWASGGSASFGNWYHNDTMDAKIEAEAATADLTLRASIFGEIQSGLAADVPYLPLWQTNQAVGFKPSVSGIVLDPIQFFPYFTIPES